MKPTAFLIGTALLLSACGSVVNETTGSYVVDGKSYELRTRTVQGSNGTYDTSSIRVNGTYYQCRPESPGSCKAAVTNANFRADR